MIYAAVTYLYFAHAPSSFFKIVLTILPHVLLTISLSLGLLIYFALFLFPLATYSFTLRAKNLSLSKSASGFNISYLYLHILYALSASVHVVLRGRCIPHAFSLRLIILRLIQSPLCQIFTDFHTFLLFFHNMTSG